MKNPCGAGKGQRQTSLASMTKVEYGLHAGFSSVAEAGLFALPIIRIGGFTAGDLFSLPYKTSGCKEVFRGYQTPRLSRRLHSIFGGRGWGPGFAARHP